MDVVTIGDATLYHGDFADVDVVADTAVTDPPYGMGIDGQKKTTCPNKKHSRKHHKFMGWDQSRPDSRLFYKIVGRTENQVIWGGNLFADLLPPARGWLVWDKGQHGLTMSDCELAYTSLDKPLRVKVLNRAAIRRDGSVHPTQKPVELMEWCVSMTHGSVLDPFMGSGSTGVACARLGRKFIGVEREREYFDIACERIEAAYSQGVMF